MTMLSQTLCLMSFLSVPITAVDDFDLYTNSVLKKLPSAAGMEPLEKISFDELQKAAPVLSRTSGSFLIVETDEGNWAKLVVRQAIRKQGTSEVPIFVIERFYTLRSGSESGRLAAGKDVYLFDGFQFDLDIGQVVPEGGGGDIEFHREGTRNGFLKTIGKSKLYLLSKPMVASSAGGDGGPSTGPVVPEDFAGKYRLVANGKWSGRLRLEVSKSGEISGSYVSDQSGGDYAVKGFVGRPTHHIKFTVELPVAKQEFDGLLWTQGKHAFAGTMTLSGTSFGFVAVREGTELMPRAGE